MRPNRFRIFLFAVPAVAVVLLSGCGSSLDDEGYVEIILAKTDYMLEEGLTAEEALTRAAEDNGTTAEDVRDFEEELANDPERLADIAERIMEESAPLRERYIEAYRQTLDEAPPSVEDEPSPTPAPNPAGEDETTEETADEGEGVEDTEQGEDAVEDGETGETIDEPAPGDDEDGGETITEPFLPGESTG
ncbi:MAG: hypothetical protein GF403_08925 [Candidatus Coatesbacteria bacterium]|nr:hypothetical protein [Candidatus Coatesbacteria bacterium]